MNAWGLAGEVGDVRVREDGHPVWRTRSSDSDAEGASLIPLQLRCMRHGRACSLLPGRSRPGDGCRRAAHRGAGGELPCLLGQPRADYQARRRSLMKQIREIEAKRSEEMRASGPGSDPHAAVEVRRVPVVVLVGQDEAPINAPALFDGKFRQTNDFAYLTGVNVPAASLVLLPNDERETLYLPPVSRANQGVEELHDGPGPDAAEKYGFCDCGINRAVPGRSVRSDRRPSQTRAGAFGDTGDLYDRARRPARRGRRRCTVLEVAP